MLAVKVTTVGNSLGIVLPREVLQRLRVDKGSLLYVVETHDGVELVPYEPSFAAQVAALEAAARSDRDVLRELAQYRPSLTAAGATGIGAARVRAADPSQPPLPAGRRSRIGGRRADAPEVSDVSDVSERSGAPDVPGTPGARAAPGAGAATPAAGDRDD